MFCLHDQPENIIKQYYKHYPKEEAREKALALKKACELEPLKYFVPNLVQDHMTKELVEAQQESPISTIHFMCGNGIGKTAESINIIGNLVWKPQSAWFDYPLFHNFPYVKHIWLITTPSNLKENYFNEQSPDASSFYRYFKGKDWNIGKEWVATKEGKSYYSKINFDNDWSLSVFTYNQQPTEMESASVGVILLDEPCPEIIWTGLPARFRVNGGIFLLPQTPVDAEPYILDDVIEKAEKKVPGYRSIQASATEVTTDKPRGHLNPKTLEAQRERYKGDDADTRIDGKLVYFKERILNNYDEKIHKVDPLDFPIRSDYLFFHVVDPGDGKPNAELWAALTPEGRYIIFADAPQPDKAVDPTPFWQLKDPLPINLHIPQFLEREGKLGITVDTRILDRHFGGQRRGAYKKTLFWEYENLGIHFDESYTFAGSKEGEIEYGHAIIRKKLTYLPDGKPGLVIWDTCFHTLNGLKHYVRRRPRTEAQLQGGKMKIVEKYKDFVDLVRYLVCNGIGIQPK